MREIVTIKQVAKAAGVSPTTVSHVLNDRGRVAEPTRERVLAVVEELSYRSNRHAQQLVTRRSGILAFYLPLTNSAKNQGAFPHSGYFLELINGATTAADKLDYALIVVPGGRHGTGNSLVSFAPEGAIVVDPQGNEPVFEAPIQLVTIGVPLQATRPVSSVDNDHAANARKVLEHFEAAGCTRPMLVADRTRRSYVRDLIIGFRKHVEKQDIAAHIHQITSLSKASLDHALDAVAASRCDAVLAGSDDIALGLLNRARRRGVEIPDQIMLASAVDAPSLSLTSPQITATNLYPRRTGAAAVRQLVDWIERADDFSSVGTRQRIPTRLIQRDSTRLMG